MKEYLASPRCKADPFSCTNQIKIDKIKQEIEYCERIFDNVRMRFMNAIDHMDYPSQTDDQGNYIGKGVLYSKRKTFEVNIYLVPIL